MTVAEAIRAAAGRMTGSDTARLDAELLMAHALGMSRSDMLVRAMREDAPEGYEALIERRLDHEPIAYIVGWQEFYGRDFAVAPGVLIPRGDSETLVDAALELAPQAERVLDLGTGSGALLVTALLELDRAHGIGIDASPTAVAIAEANAQAHGLIGARARFLERSWHDDGWAHDLGRFDLVLCNPPYVEEDAPLEPQVRDHEPAEALFAGAEGLDDYRALIPQLGKLLSPDGIAIFEIGHTQVEAVEAIGASHGFVTQMRRDLAKRPRAIVLS